MSEFYKIVLIPVEVCQGDYCAGGPDHRICTYHSNECAVPECDKGFGDLEYDKKGQVLKPDICRLAREI